MRSAIALLTGFIAAGATTSATPTFQPDPNKASENVLPSQPNQADAFLRTGCQVGSLCSAITVLQNTLIYAAKNVECQYCTDENPCSVCGPSKLGCVGCNVFQCSIEFLNTTLCIEAVNDPSAICDDDVFSTAQSVGSPGINTISAVVVPEMGNEQHDLHGQNISLRDVIHPLSSRHAAFTRDQCVACDSSECPDCHKDCPECQHFKCVDLENNLSMCMSVRPEHLVPCDPIPPPVSIVTTTVHFLPVPTPLSSTTRIITITQRSMAKVEPLPTAIASPSVVTVSTVETTTRTIYTPWPSESTTTVYMEVSVVPVAPSPTIPTPELSTKLIMLAGDDKSMVPRAQVTGSLATSRTMTNVVRATQVPGLLPRQKFDFKDNSCRFCEDAPGCEDCKFTCPGCGHLQCQNPRLGSKVCIEFLLANTYPVQDDATDSDRFLGHAATLLVSQDPDAIVSANVSDAAHAIAENSDPRLPVSFHPEDCHVCSPGDEFCSVCKWEYACGAKTWCSRSFDGETLQVCFEVGMMCTA